MSKWQFVKYLSKKVLPMMQKATLLNLMGPGAPFTNMV